jgi:hypothetical protein
MANPDFIALAEAGGAQFWSSPNNLWSAYDPDTIVRDAMSKAEAARLYCAVKGKAWDRGANAALLYARTVRKLRITVVMDAAPFVQVGVPPDTAPSRTTVVVSVAGRTVTAEISTKSIRRAVKALQEHGPNNITLTLQGALAANNHLDEAGLVAKIKTQKGRGGANV